MTLRKLFEHRSGRVIAAFRAILALVFFVAVTIQPVTGAENLGPGQALLGAYLIASACLMALAWRSWWYDQILAPGLLVFDIAVFIAAVFLTESSAADFGSPFLALFALVVLSTTLRWGSRTAAQVGLVVTLLFLVVGLTLDGLHVQLDMFRFGRRIFYMLALLLILLWFGLQRHETQVPAFDPPAEPGGEEATLWAALEYAIAQTGASTGVLAWSEAEEPWIAIRCIAPAGRWARREGPTSVPGWNKALEDVRLYDAARRRKMVRDEQGRIRCRTLVNPLPFVSPASDGLAAGAQGLSIPFHAASGEGLIVLSGIPGPGPDFVFLGQSLAREIGGAFDRVAVAVLEREALLTRTRGAIARDLHDSVAQSLAGACFRLEALRRMLEQGGSESHEAENGELATSNKAADEIGAIRDALRREQGHVRSLIDGLRSPGASLEMRELVDDLREALADAGSHWGLGVALEGSPSAILPGWLSHEVRQLIREAVANAARHGQARRVRVVLDQTGTKLGIAVIDDGRGFDTAAQGPHPQGPQPWSIRERIETLGGTLAVNSNQHGTRLDIALPTGVTA